MIYSVLGGLARTVEIVPDKSTDPAYSMGTHHFREYLNDAIFYKTYKLQDFLDHYRFSSYGERYINKERMEEITNLQLFAPEYT
jgi:hypothetical protein